MTTYHESDQLDVSLFPVSTVVQHGEGEQVLKLPIQNSFIHVGTYTLFTGIDGIRFQ